MTALHRKLLRDLWRMRAQVITIALVVACGIASHVTVEGTRVSLLDPKLGVPIETIGRQDIRPPLKPLPLGKIATVQLETVP